ncbi:Cof-type HAD-IIB family hydrolase [Reinekea sp.]|jgi:Cof subfamily protein (haloacid dehalogenase superfamily)|uniref:Cof-type HAD-IIB family hydrolase n=1 Tax=Reinekea sp. TaxID=1970455 RepID=UPI002A816DA2|nr:Cof-type HAD-IIB family hydrolase [Reinekea sp.]
MKKNVKMIVMDLDDTLLNDDLVISDYTKGVIGNAQRSGIKIVIASGRPTPAIWRYAQELKLAENNGYVISYNGAIAHRCDTSEEIFRCTLTWENIDLLNRVYKEKSAFIHTYIDNQVVTPEHNPHTDFEGKLTGMPVVKVDDFRAEIKQEVVKILLLEEPTRLKQIEAELRPLIGDSMSMNISKPFFLEFTNKRVDKSKTIDFLCALENIDMQDVMAIGDSYNDITMIRDCGFGVAMNNGPVDVKIHAAHITHCNNTDGVATAINRFVLAV